jgi:hypothetical protein
VLALTHRYPTQLIDRWTLADGRRVTLRPVLPQDAELEQAMVRGLSREGRYHRYFAPIRELSPQALAALAQVDYRRHLALVVETFVDGEPLVVAEAGCAASSPSWWPTTGAGSDWPRGWSRRSANTRTTPASSASRAT